MGRFTPPAPISVEDQPEDIPLAVLYEDRHLIVIDKPAGMVVHPATSHQAGTLVNALLHHCGDSLSGVGGGSRPLGGSTINDVRAPVRFWEVNTAL